MPPESAFRLRVVIDANVFVSYLLRISSVPGRAVVAALDRCTVISSDPLMAEIAEVSGRTKFRRYLIPAVRAAFLERLERTVEYAHILQHHSLCRDPKDNVVIDTAVAGGARYVITGDEDLLCMPPVDCVEFIRPADFLRLL